MSRSKRKQAHPTPAVLCSHRNTASESAEDESDHPDLSRHPMQWFGLLLPNEVHQARDHFQQGCMSVCCVLCAVFYAHAHSGGDCCIVRGLVDHGAALPLLPTLHC